MAGWDPKTEGDPGVTGQEPDPAVTEGVPESPERDPPPPEGDPETLKRDPVSPKSDFAATSDPKVRKRDPKTPKRDPAAPKWDPTASKKDPPSPRRTPPAEGDPDVPRGCPGGLGTERWRPEICPLGRPRRSPARTRLRNRRYAALRQLIQGGEYFSEEEMRAREPLLYQHYIGRYRGAETFSGDPASAPPYFLGTPPGPQSLTGLLLRSVEEAAVQRRLRRQRLRDGESEGSDEEGDPSEDPRVPDAAERAMLREEFTSRMYQRFLDGEDGDFDYSQVDENPDLDNLDIVSRDAEERYFDEEEPSDAPQLE